MLQLQSWGFPPRIAQLREMAEELLITSQGAKQDFKELGKNLSEKFLGRHSVLQSKERVLAQNRDSIREWFDLYWYIGRGYI